MSSKVAITSSISLDRPGVDKSISLIDLKTRYTSGFFANILVASKFLILLSAASFAIAATFDSIVDMIFGFFLMYPSIASSLTSSILLTPASAAAFLTKSSEFLTPIAVNSSAKEFKFRSSAVFPTILSI